MNTVHAALMLCVFLATQNNIYKNITLTAILNKITQIPNKY